MHNSPIDHHEAGFPFAPGTAMLTVKDIMSTSVESIRPDATVRELMQLLAQEQISGVPVVDESGQLTGVVSATDIILRAAVQGPSAATRWDNYKVEQIMTPGPMTVTPDTTVSELAKFMLQCHVHRALVTSGGAMVGIVTTFDLLRVLTRR